MKSQSLKTWILVVATVLASLALYLPRLPLTVQMGDTGEMVADAYRLFVPHPPGYPLFTWIMHGATHWLAGPTPFWRAAFINLCFATLTLALLAFQLRHKPLAAFGFALALGTSNVFWKFAELPDVFAMNALLGALILTFAVDPELHRFRPLSLFIFAIALAHHHTIVFLAPVIAWVFFLELKNKWAWIAGLSGVAITFALYLTLFVMHPDEFWSWGHLNSFENLWRHFIRADFGTFRLIGNTEAGSFIANFGRFSLQIFPAALAAISAFVFAIWFGRRFKFEDLALSLSFAGSIAVFCALSNMELFAFRLETFDRFTILPSVLLFFFCARFMADASLPKWTSILIAVLLMVNAAYSYSNFAAANDFSKNTVVEDYSINLLNARPAGRPTLALIVTDTRYNGIKYAQTVLGIQPDIVAIHPTMLFFKWYSEKSVSSGLVLDLRKMHEEGDIRDVDGFILDNLKKHVVLTNLELSTFDRFHVTYVRPGKRVSEGEGQDFVFEPEPWIQRSDISVTTTPRKDYDVFRDLWSDYGIYHFKKADWLYKQRRRDEAKVELEKAVELVPWSLTSKANLCVLLKEEGKDATSCYDDVMKTGQENFAYF